jgi:hypothetical protein
MNNRANRPICLPKAFMRGDVRRRPKALRTKNQIHHELVRVLAGQDPFWPRWIVHVKAGSG